MRKRSFQVCTHYFVLLLKNGTDEFESFREWSWLLVVRLVTLLVVGLVLVILLVVGLVLVTLLVVGLVTLLVVGLVMVTLLVVVLVTRTARSWIGIGNAARSWIGNTARSCIGNVHVLLVVGLVMVVQSSPGINSLLIVWKPSQNVVFWIVSDHCPTS